ncbi:MAG: hypothetical protein ACP5R4_14050 [Armatimonadota bacterium]
MGGKQLLALIYNPKAEQAVLNIRYNSPNCPGYLRRLRSVFPAEQCHNSAGGQNVQRGGKLTVRKSIADGVA